MTQEVLKLSQEALAGLKDVEKQVRELVAENKALKEALAQEKALQALHNENERLGLYKDAYAEQEPVAWKLMPRDATDSMLKAMDECSTEGYDERLYAGHAASVYTAAWDAAPITPAEQGPTGCACRWDSEGDRVVTCARHEGWLEVIAEWADRAREAEKKLKALAREKALQALHNENERLGLYKDAYAQPEQEPVAWVVYSSAENDIVWADKGKLLKQNTPLYTNPPQRTWVGLTEDERDHLTGLHLYAVRGQVEAWIEGVDDFAQAYEAKLKEKNT